MNIEIVESDIMRTFVFSLLVDYMPNGIDNAQGYREKMFEQIGINAFYVFTEFPKMRNISLYNKVGIPINKMTTPHLKLTDRNNFNFIDQTNSMIEILKNNLGDCEIKKLEGNIQFWKKGYIIAEIHTLPWDKDCFYEVFYFKNNCLIRSDFYSDGIVYSDFFITDKRVDGTLYAKKVKRSYYKKNMSKCFEQFDAFFVLADGCRVTLYELIDLFLEKLNLNKDDSLILDRAYNLEFNEVIFEKKLSCKKICVLHSGHYFQPNQSQYALYLNYEYYYWFKYSKFIDSFVVSTEEQKKDLINILSEFKYIIPKINVIPVGAIEELRVSNKRMTNSILTASRIVKGKRLDLIIRAVIEANKKCKVNLDIYGNGDPNVENELKKIIEKNNAMDYIKFRGYQNLKSIYEKYQLYISTSTFETFGLTLLEAASAGCALIGLNVPYGCTTFIENEKNGYLIDYNFDCSEIYEKDLVLEIADRIVKVFSDYKRLNDFSEHSYKIASEFLLSKISFLWRNIL